MEVICTNWTPECKDNDCSLSQGINHWMIHDINNDEGYCYTYNKFAPLLTHKNLLFHLMVKKYKKHLTFK